jgi:hypothetical protein
VTWLSIDGADNKKNGRAVYVARWDGADLDHVADWTLEEARGQYIAGPPAPSHVVVERTQADGRLGRGKTTPKVMVGLAWNTAAIAYTLARGAPVHEYTISAGGEDAARDWIGGTNKAALHSRIWSALAPAERAVVASFGRHRVQRAATGRYKLCAWGTGGLDDIQPALVENCKRAATGRDLLKHDWYDVLDAVGVGLFHLGRVGKGAAPVRHPRVALP